MHIGYIAVADYRNVHRRFYPANTVPVCVAAVHFFSCAAVYRHGGSAVLLRDLGQLHHIGVRLVPALAQFHRYRQVNGLCHRVDDLTCQLWVFH